MCIRDRSKRALEGLAQFKEVNLFLRGLVPLVGYRSSSVYYERHERLAGESHYPLKKMLSFAFDGITSLSVKPIRLITGLGFFISLASFIGIIWVLLTKLFGTVVSGWASMTCAILDVYKRQILFFTLARVTAASKQESYPWKVPLVSFTSTPAPAALTLLA